MPRQSRRPADLTVLKIREPGDLLEVVPYLLGFRPTDSMVLIGLASGRVGVTARLDLADAADARALSEIITVVGRGAPAELVAVIYDDSAPGRARHDLFTAIRTAAETAGAHIADVLHVADSRWWSYVCADPACCPDEGRPMPGCTSPAPAAATYAGLVALESREDLAATLAPFDESEQAALEPLIATEEHAAVSAVLEGHADRRRRKLKRELFAATRSLAVLPDADVARFGVALSEIEIRDAAWLAVDDRRIDGRDLWRELGRRLPPPYAAAPLFLFGWASWREGNGALARIAVDRALESHPDYYAALLLQGALDNAVDPHRMPRLRPARSA